MKIIPAIDIRNGKCVRLTRGDFDREIIYGDDPVSVAKRFEKEGAEILHIVDLDGAKNGSQKNFAVIEKIARAVNIPIQVGGGIRNKKTADMLHDIGVSRIVLGTVALENKEELQFILENYLDKIVVALETKNGVLMQKGWIEKSDKDIFETAIALEKMGVKKILFTDILRDGMLTEPNYQEIGRLKKKIRIPIIASGGISSKETVSKLRSLGIDEVIIGKAFYEGKIGLKEAMYAV